MDDDVVWEGTVDADTWYVRVVRDRPYVARITVTRNGSNTVILDETTMLQYNAPFGPDTYDVRMWQHMAVEAIDHYDAQNPVEKEIRRRLRE